MSQTEKLCLGKGITVTGNNVKKTLGQEWERMIMKARDETVKLLKDEGYTVESLVIGFTTKDRGNEGEPATSLKLECRRWLRYTEWDQDIMKILRWLIDQINDLILRDWKELDDMEVELETGTINEKIWEMIEFFESGDFETIYDLIREKEPDRNIPHQEDLIKIIVSSLKKIHENPQAFVAEDFILSGAKERWKNIPINPQKILKLLQGMLSQFEGIKDKFDDEWSSPNLGLPSLHDTLIKWRFFPDISGGLGIASLDNFLYYTAHVSIKCAILCDREISLANKNAMARIIDLVWRTSSLPEILENENEAKIYGILIKKIEEDVVEFKKFFGDKYSEILIGARNMADEGVSEEDMAQHKENMINNELSRILDMDETNLLDFIESRIKKDDQRWEFLLNLFRLKWKIVESNDMKVVNTGKVVRYILWALGKR